MPNELVVGALRALATATLPVIAAVCGRTVPAALYEATRPASTPGNVAGSAAAYAPPVLSGALSVRRRLPRTRLMRRRRAAGPRLICPNCKLLRIWSSRHDIPFVMRPGDPGPDAALSPALNPLPPHAVIRCV
ncbi:Na+/H+ antiporter NhaA [Streptomyces sp. NPDC048430]|uniref:Na+/H+ antiporter NhaA n=1 Tax=unclassified Streptomyces TaxID=2593676 RepID=UPI00342F11C4